MPLANRLGATLLVGALLAAGCSGDDEGTTTEPATTAVQPAAEVQVPTTEDASAPGTMFEGIVEYVPETGCAILVSSATRYAVVWPAGTTAQLDPFSLTFADGTVAEDGARIRGPGAQFPPDTLEIFTDEHPDCAWYSRRDNITLDQAWVFNHDAEIEIVE